MLDEIRLNEILQSTENETIEFKQELSGNDSFLKDVCSFANCNGGLIIFGIEDKTRNIIGIDKLDILKLEEQIANKISDNFDNRPPFVSKITNYKGSLLLILEVFQGELIPYFIKSKGKQNGTYTRLGSTSKPSSIEEIAELERRRQHISFDTTEIINAKKEHLDYGQIEHYLNTIAYKHNKQPQTLTDKLLESLKILRKVGNKLIPTVGGILLFGYSDKIEHHLPQAKIKCARFKGNNSLEYLDKKEFGGSLIKQFESAMHFYNLNEPKIAIIDGLERKENFIIPEIAIREAIINALVHRNYAISGSDIKFNIFDDHIKIISPGRLPFGITKKYLTQSISEIRNKLIASVFANLGYFEQWGEGIQKIIEVTEAKNLNTPTFEEAGNLFIVTLYKTKNAKLIEERVSQIHFRNFTTKEIMTIINDINKNGPIANAKCQHLLDIEAYKAKHILDRLVKENILIATGYGKGRKYTIAD